MAMALASGAQRTARDGEEAWVEEDGEAVWAEGAAVCARLLVRRVLDNQRMAVDEEEYE